MAADSSWSKSFRHPLAQTANIPKASASGNVSGSGKERPMIGFQAPSKVLSVHLPPEQGNSKWFCPKGIWPNNCWWHKNRAKSHLAAAPPPTCAYRKCCNPCANKLNGCRLSKNDLLQMWPQDYYSVEMRKRSCHGLYFTVNLHTQGRYLTRKKVKIQSAKKKDRKLQWSNISGLQLID